MDSIVDSLRLGWDALLFKEGAYEKMSSSPNPVAKGLVLILIVGVVIALLGIVGTTLEWASIPNLDRMQETIFDYITRMPGWDEAVRLDPGFEEQFEASYNLGWDIFPQLFGAPDIGGAALGIVFTPVGLIIRWLIYGLLAYLFARWLGGTGDLSMTLGALALAVAPQALRVFNVLPFVEVGSLISIWGILCAYYGLKVVHKLSWGRTAWATVLPYVLALVLLILAGCAGTALLGVVIGG
jgi:hypothetical protein